MRPCTFVKKPRDQIRNPGVALHLCGEVNTDDKYYYVASPIIARVSSARLCVVSQGESEGKRGNISLGLLVWVLDVSQYAAIDLCFVLWHRHGMNYTDFIFLPSECVCLSLWVLVWYVHMYVLPLL